jgi:hypothetical protein
VNKFAVICGIVRRLMASTMPTILKVETIDNAMNAIIAYSMKVTGNFCDRAKVSSKAML